MTRTSPTIWTPSPTSFITTRSWCSATTYARIGSYSAPFGYFREWKRLDEDEPGVGSQQEEVHAGNVRHLKRLLGRQRAYVFSPIQKFNQDVVPGESYSEREEIQLLFQRNDQCNELSSVSYINDQGTKRFVQTTHVMEKVIPVII